MNALTQSEAIINKTHKNKSKAINAYVLCDASHDKDLKIASVAGSTVIGGVGVRFCEIICDVDNSVEAEMLAISKSLTKLKQRMTAEGLDAENLHIFSDSQYGIDAIHDETKASETFAFLKEKIWDQLRTLGLSYRIHKVKAHTKKSEANSIEASHNEIDVLAREGLRDARQLFERSGEGSDYFGVVLDNQIRKKHQGRLYEIGAQLGKRGKIPRIAFEGRISNPEAHPFIQGFRSVNNQELQLIRWDDHYMGVNDTETSCNGLERALVYKWNSQKAKKLKNIEWTSGKMSKAGASCRVIFGLQEPCERKNVQPNNWKELPSAFVINLSICAKYSIYNAKRLGGDG